MTSGIESLPLPESKVSNHLAGLHLMGKIATPEVRLPMTEMNEASLNKLTAEMKAVGLI